MADSLFIIEDDYALARELERHFSGKGWDVEVAGRLSAARDIMTSQRHEPLVILADMSLLDGNALDLLERMREQKIPGEWILLTGYGSVPDSLRPLRVGVYDFLEKPCPLSRLEIVVAGARRSAQALRRLQTQTRDNRRRYASSSYLVPERKPGVIQESAHRIATETVLIN